MSVALFLICILVFGSCAQRASQSNQKNQSVKQHHELRSGLQIENRTNRGTNYTDPSGVDYNIRNIPVKITNDTTISIRLQLTFDKQYRYPEPNHWKPLNFSPYQKHGP